MRLILIFASLVLAAASSHAVERSGEPLTFTHAINWKYDTSLQLEALDLAKLSVEDTRHREAGGPVRVAIARQASRAGEFVDQGEWSEIDDMSIWRFKVDATHAEWVSFAFDQVFLPPGASLYVYNERRTEVFGPYTDADNKASRQLWTPMVSGDAAYVEINVPTRMKPYLSFDLKTLNQGYRDLKSLNTSKAGACNIDVICPQGDAWRDEIRSVARYIFDSNGGTFTCTGNLVNNVTGDRKAYFMTASHCVSTAAEVQSMRLFWNFEKSVCGGPSDGSQAQTQSGATLLATVGSLGGPEPQRDMTLVELDDVPDAAFNVHWSGWDAGPDLPTSGVSIHHPDGTEKRISVDSGPIVLTNFGSTVQRPDGSHLMIAAWDEGTTEGGSSGSGFWNQDQRIVGVLSGGGASCDTPDAPDFYAHLASHYDVGTSSATRMKAWLDPNDTGILQTNGVDACTEPQVAITAAPNPTQVGQTVTFTSTVTGVTGANTYAWDFDGDGNTDSTDADPTFVYTSSYLGNVTLEVTSADACTGSASAAIVVTAAGGNNPPVAAASAAQSTVDEGTSVVLSAAASSDPDGDALSYVWSQTAGPTVVLTNTDAVQATATMPFVTSDTAVTFEVTVSDPFGAQDTATVDVTVGNVNQAPVAIVSNPSLSVTEGATVTLNAGASSDADGDTLTFAWSQTSGPSVTLNSATASSASFTAPQVSASTSFGFSVTVSDPAGLMDSASVTVTVTDTPVTPPASGGGGGGGALGWVALSALMFVALARRVRTVRLGATALLLATSAACSTPETQLMSDDNATAAARSSASTPAVRLLFLSDEKRS